MPVHPPRRAVETAVRIRRARASERAALVELENRSFASDRLSPRQWGRHLASPSVHVMVALAVDQLVGAAVVFLRRNSDIARLYSLAVDESRRGTGLGKALLDAAEVEARRSGCTRMRLEVRKDNPAAQQLYRARGYVLIGQRLSYYEDGEDALRFEKLIADA